MLRDVYTFTFDLSSCVPWILFWYGIVFWRWCSASSCSGASSYAATAELSGGNALPPVTLAFCGVLRQRDCQGAGRSPANGM